jgi:hypothetical protein
MNGTVTLRKLEVFVTTQNWAAFSQERMGIIEGIETSEA